MSEIRWHWKSGRQLAVGDLMPFGSSVHRVTGLTPYMPNPWGFEGWQHAEWDGGASGITIAPDGAYRVVR